MYTRQNIFIRTVKTPYVFNTFKTAIENEYTIGKILYDFVYTSLNLIIFYRGLYSKESFSLRQIFGIQLPHMSQVDHPDIVNYIRTITEKIVNFHVADLLEGFAYEECNRRTRERFVLKFHYYGSINLTPTTFEEFQGNLEDLKVSCKSLVFDLKRTLRARQSSIQSRAKSGSSIEKQRKKPRWKIVVGLKAQDDLSSARDTNKIGVFKNDPDWEIFPWKKSKVDDDSDDNSTMDRTKSNGSASLDSDCGSPDMFEDALEIFEDLEEKVSQDVVITTNTTHAVSTTIKADGIHIVKDKQITTPTSGTTKEDDKKACLKMFAVSSVQMIDTLMCNILLLTYPPRIPLRKYDNENSNPFKKQMYIKKRRALVFD